MADRNYVIGVPLAVTVHDDGSVTFDVDLCEVAGRDLDNYVPVDDETFAADTETIGAAVEKLRRVKTFTVTP